MTLVITTPNQTSRNDRPLSRGKMIGAVMRMATRRETRRRKYLSNTSGRIAVVAPNGTAI
jgi:hypothetical protein